MKKFVILIFVLIITSGIFNIYAQDTNNNRNFMYVQLLIRDDLSNNYDTIKVKSKDLSFEQKNFIYNEYCKSPGVPFVLNLFLGFGIGSWTQEDVSGGLLGTIGGLGGLLLYSSNDNTSFYRYLGFFSFIGTWIIDLISPFTYSKKYNKKLRYALGLSDVTNILIIPDINVTRNGKIAPSVLLQLQF